MPNNPLEYRLLQPAQQVDKTTELKIINSISQILKFMDSFGPEGKNPKIIVDNNAISMITPNSTMITAIGYFPRDATLYCDSPSCYSPTSIIRIPLPKSLEEMTEQELREIGVQESGFNINTQMFVALKEYVLEQQK